MPTAPAGRAEETPRYSQHVMFPSGDGWDDWQRDYRYGALVIEPPRELAAVLDPIRERFDRISADRLGAHITVTPPFVGAPTPADEALVGSVVRRIPSMRLQLGRPRQFGGSSVIYLPVVNAGAVTTVREALLATGLFRLDLPHTTDFVPHLTISEFGTTPAAALRAVIPAPGARPFHVGAIAWLVPDDGFQFAVRRTFALEADE
jgi:2'-5' RNA ligase